MSRGEPRRPFDAEKLKRPVDLPKFLVEQKTEHHGRGHARHEIGHDRDAKNKAQKPCFLLRAKANINDSDMPTPVPEQLHVVLEPRKFLLAPEELRIEQAAPGGVENGKRQQ